MALVPVLASCYSQVSLEFAPKDFSEAADLAHTVADQAACGNFEKRGAFGSSGNWAFDCQIKDRSFSIHVSKTENFGSAAGFLDTDRKIGKYFVVSENETLGQERSMSALDPFPGVAYPKEFSSPPMVKKF